MSEKGARGIAGGRAPVVGLTMQQGGKSVLMAVLGGERGTGENWQGLGAAQQGGQGGSCSKGAQASP